MRGSEHQERRSRTARLRSRRSRRREQDRSGPPGARRAAQPACAPRGAEGSSSCDARISRARDLGRHPSSAARTPPDSSREGRHSRVRPGGRVIIDASALVAIVLREPGFEGLEQKIAGAKVTAVGCPTATEAAIVLDARLGAPAGHTKLMRLVHEWAITLVPFGENHWKQAVVAYARLGRA